MRPTRRSILRGVLATAALAWLPMRAARASVSGRPDGVLMRVLSVERVRAWHRFDEPPVWAVRAVEVEPADPAAPRRWLSLTYEGPTTAGAVPILAAEALAENRPLWVSPEGDQLIEPARTVGHDWGGMSSISLAGAEESTGGVAT